MAPEKSKEGRKTNKEKKGEGRRKIGRKGRMDNPIFETWLRPWIIPEQRQFPGRDLSAIITCFASQVG